MSRLTNPRKTWSFTAGILLRLYLALFLVGCVSRRPPVTVTEARSMETRTIVADYDKVLKASINVLQDQRYNLDVIDGDLGLIVASRSTEGQQTRLAREPARTVDAPTWQKVLGITLFIALIGGIIWLITRSGDDDQGDRDRTDGSRSRRGDTHVYHNGGDRGPDGPRIYQYKVTVNVESLASGETHLRVSGTGERTRGDRIEQAGPIEDPEFFQRFFAGLDKALFLED